MRNDKVIRFLRPTCDCRFCGARAVILLRDRVLPCDSQGTILVDYFCATCAKAAGNTWARHAALEIG